MAVDCDKDDDEEEDCDLIAACGDSIEGLVGIDDP